MAGHRFRNVTLESYDPWDPQNYSPYLQMSMRPERFLQDRRPTLESGYDALLNYLGLIQRFRCNLLLEVSESTYVNKDDLRIRDCNDVRPVYLRFVLHVVRLTNHYRQLGFHQCKLVLNQALRTYASHNYFLSRVSPGTPQGAARDRDDPLLSLEACPSEDCSSFSLASKGRP
jgi:hypothetical protein